MPSILRGAAGSSRGVRSITRLGLWLVACLSGCGEQADWIPAIKDPAFPVKGRVLLPNGKPLTSGRIEFYPVKDPGLIAHGELASDGTFELRTREPGDGAIPGEYKVRIMIPEKKEYGRLANYRDEDGSKLKATVKAEPNNLAPFRLR
jgi:hypothetical protein